MLFPKDKKKGSKHQSSRRILSCHIKYLGVNFMSRTLEEVIVAFQKSILTRKLVGKGTIDYIGSKLA
jgi:hypothetical protein